MNKTLIILVLMLVGLVVASAVILLTMRNKKTNTTIDKPPVVDHFACSDYCPGPREKYLVKIYEGVTDEDQCIKLGGEFRSYTGWSTNYICVVK